ncbi:MAG: hypothetical protein COA78_37390 [Blastopirellula sp.]|nr:MAG: hypothetical protein COA78_37390 [Blastopirellula sp.]
MRKNYHCGSAEHAQNRRGFLSTLSLGAASSIVGGLGVFAQPSAAAELKSQQRRVLVIDMRGGVSQLETWDPKPGTENGGPFRAIPTAVPGTHISELLPHTAKIMDKLAIVRGINTKENDHGKGRYAMLTGRRQSEPGDYPYLGAVAAKALSKESSPLPGHIVITPKGKGRRSSDAAYLGPKYNSMQLDGGNPPENSVLPSSISAADEKVRHDIRRFANERFALRRRSAETNAYTHSYEQALQLMERRDVFDISNESKADQDKYGSHDFGRHCLLARRLLENDISFVQVTHTNYDSHYLNFDFHIEQMAEFDKPFSLLVNDLKDRGMLESTLIVVLSEFGRTPKINARLGRDHWGTAWSIALGGCGIQNGAVIGKTNENGTAVTDREVDHAHLFHTYLQAVGVDSTGTFDIAGRELPIANPASEPIKELLL